MRACASRFSLYKTLPLACALALSAAALGGCQAQRPVIESVEPTWTYRDGTQQLSNNDTWEQMIPASALLRFNQSQVASVEDPTD